MKKLVPMLMALLLLLSTATPAAAYKFTGGWYTNQAIADGRLGVCYTGGTPPHTNRAVLNDAMRVWGTAVGLAFDSLGACPKEGTNIAIGWGVIDNITGCLNPAVTHGRANGYASMTIVFNSRCNGAIYWGATTPVPAGQYDGYTTIIHEVGHALGLHHENEWAPHNGSRDLMDQNSGNCVLGQRSGLSADDANGLRARYPGLPATFNVFPQPAFCWD